jgi:hypothetical protein
LLSKNINIFFKNNKEFIAKVLNEMNLLQKSKNLELYSKSDFKDILHDLVLKFSPSDDHTILYIHITFANFFLLIISSCRTLCDNDLFGQELFQNDEDEYELND